MLVRRSTPADAAAVRAIHAAAFGRGEGTPAEVVLVDALVAAGDAIDALALVAEQDGVAVGHVVCSRAWVDAVEVSALGPIGVLPEHQGSGVGTALMHAVVAAADALELQLVGLVGYPAYYRRFGFVRASSIGVEPPDPAWDEYFQVRTLSAYGGARGRFRYAAAFENL